MWYVSCAGGAEESGWDKYIGTYSIPEGYGRPWFGFELEIFEVNDNYVDYDFTYSNVGNAAAFEEDRAYFVNEYIAEGNGRSGYADETKRKNIKNKLTFYDDHIHFDTTGLGGDGMDFYPIVSGKFTKSKIKDWDYENDVFYLVCDDYYINVSGKTLRIIDTETYDTIFTEDNVSWDFISDGSALYYHNWKTLKSWI